MGTCYIERRYWCFSPLIEKNEPPKAEAGGPYHVRYPTTSAVLDGSKSDDDYKKGMKYSWVQTR